MATIPGSPGDDTLVGSINPAEVDTFLGSAGSDSITGINDLLDYSAFATPIAVTLTAPRDGTVNKTGVGTDTFESIVRLFGSQGDDSLVGIAQPVGSIENFLFEGREGDDSIDGAGNRNIVAYYAAAPGGIVADLGAGTVQDGYGFTDRLTNVVSLNGSGLRDTILGGSANEVLQGDGGGDSIDGGAGNDVLGGGEGNDTLNGGSGRDTLRGGDGADVLVIGAVGGTTGGSVFGDNGSDDITGRTVSAGGSFVFLTGGGGSDTIRGFGVAENTADYGDQQLGVTATLGVTGSATRGAPEADVLLDIRRIRGSAGDDSITGSAAAEFFLLGRGGADTVDGGTGTDRVEYLDFLRLNNEVVGAGVSVNLATGRATVGGALQLLSGIENVSGSDFDDVLTGDAGNNSIIALAGADTIAGGDGFDTLNYSTTANFVTGGIYGTTQQVGVNLDLTLGQGTDPWGFIDRFTGIEQVIGVNNRNDIIRGSAAADRFGATSGNDGYDGAGGNDTTDYGVVLAASHSIVATALAPTAGLFGYGNFTVVKTANLDGVVTTDTLANVNVVWGTAGADRYLGTNAAYAWNVDVFRGGAGDDTIEGFANVANRADYGSAAGAVTLDLQASIDGQGRRIGTAADGQGGTDTLIDVIGVRASNQDDTLRGSDRADSFTVGALGQHDIDGRAGLNEIRYAGTDDVTIDLGTTAAPGGFGGFAGSIAKAAGTDTLANIAVAQGGAGNDTVRGTTGDNQLSGGIGNNLIEGRAGYDTLIYRYFTGLAAPTAGAVVNLNDGQTGTATNPWGGTDTLTSIEGVTGSQFADDLTGALATNLFSFLRGDGGNDTLRAAAVDSLVTADYRSSLSRVVVNLALNRTLDDGWFGGTDTLVDIQAVRGSNFDDSLTGGARSDRLEGGAGNDTLTGGAGNDRLIGGAGDDTYIVDSNADGLVEVANGGIDTVRAGVTYVLRAEFEVLEQTGTGALIGVGNAGANRLVGNAGNNRLVGQAGSDTLAGGLGLDTLFGQDDADSLAGGDGNDLLVGGNGDDTIVGEAGNDGLYGEAGNDGLTGGDGQDRLVGGAGSDTLAGGDGQDTLVGGDGADTADGGAGDDLLYGDGGADSMLGGAGNDLMFGGDGNDTMDGGIGMDRAVGGAGNDTYFVDREEDRVAEAVGGGNDTVFASVAGGSFRLAPQLEQLILLGTTSFGYGNDGANRITGSDGANTLLGGAGSDTLIGGLGNDAIYGQGGADVIVMRRGDGADVLVDFDPTEDQVDLSDFGFTGFAQVSAAITQFGSVASLNLGGGDRLTFRNTVGSSLAADDFIL